MSSRKYLVIVQIALILFAGVSISQVLQFSSPADIKDTLEAIATLVLAVANAVALLASSHDVGQSSPRKGEVDGSEISKSSSGDAGVGG